MALIPNPWLISLHGKLALIARVRFSERGTFIHTGMCFLFVVVAQIVYVNDLSIESQDDGVIDLFLAVTWLSNP